MESLEVRSEAQKSRNKVAIGRNKDRSKPRDKHVQSQ